MLTENENLLLEQEFPSLKYPVPPVSTANWDLNAWRKWLTAHLWLKDKNYYVNQITGEKRIWHPLTEVIGSRLYNTARKLNNGKKLRK